MRLNKHHDFYSKIYLRSSSQSAIEGIDFLLWAISTAEYNNTNPELRPIFEDMRAEISANLKKLLSEVPMPDEIELAEVKKKWYVRK